MAQQQVSLFGPSVADVRRQIEQEDINRINQSRTGAAGVADLSLQASTRMGRAIGGLFGVEDPRLKEASARQELKNSISAQWDGQDPVEAYKIMAREATRLGLTQEAIAAAAQVKQAEEAKAKTGLEEEVKRAQIGKYSAETTAAEAKAEAARREKITSPFGKVDPDKFTPESLDKFQQSGNYKDLVPADPTKYTDPYMSTGADGRPILVQRNLRTNQVEPVDKSSKVNVSATANTALPKNLKAIGEVRQDFLRTIDPYVKSYNTASTAETMFNQALQGNFQGWRAAITQLAKSVGDSQISAREIEAYGLDPSLVGSIVDKANVLFTGTPSRDTILGAKKIATAIKDINQQRSRKEQEVYLDLATKAEGYSPEARRYFDLPMLSPGTDTGTNQRKTSRGTAYTVE